MQYTMDPASDAKSRFYFDMTPILVRYKGFGTVDMKTSFIYIYIYTVP